MGKMVNVTNRNNGFTGYTIPDTGITRSFNIDETKKIDIEELKQLQYVPGGEYLLKHFLVINDKSALEVLNMLKSDERMLKRADRRVLCP